MEPSASTPTSDRAIEIRCADSDEERDAVYRFRYSVYVEELGRYRSTADHRHRRLADPEDDHSLIVYATDGRDVVGSLRVTWGGDGFSPRQIDQYQLEPFLAEIDARHLIVGERTMIAPAWRGSDIFERIAASSSAFSDERDVLVAFGACEPHLISFYARHQRPYGSTNICSAEAGYLIPLVSFPRGVEALANLRADRQLPTVIRDVVAGTGTVTSPIFLGDARYLELARRALEATASSLVEDLDADEVSAVLRRSNIVDFRAGDRLVKSGGSAHNLFVLLDGELDVIQGGRWVASITPGETVGEMAYVLEQPRGADVSARSDGRILSLSERTLRRLIDDEPAVAAKLHFNLARQLCSRLRETTGAASTPG